MNRFHNKGTAAGALCAVAVLCLLGAAPAGAGSLVPRGKNVFFGLSDSGDSADFGQFSSALHKHPALIESFRTWGSDFPDSIERWQAARARPVLHISTADNGDGHEIITPRGIATGGGDEYLVRLNKLFWAKKMRAYIRPLGEPNRCLNVYAAYDCAGEPRDDAHSTHWYKLAFRRIYVIVHGGGKRARIDARLREAGLPPLNSDVAGLPRAPVEVIWSPLPAGSPTVPHNRPRFYYPGDPWVDWAGTDFYADNQDWKSLYGLYRRYSGKNLSRNSACAAGERRTKRGKDAGRPNSSAIWPTEDAAPRSVRRRQACAGSYATGSKPFAITEWSVDSGDDSAYVRKLMTWVDHHRRTKMLVYYQDFGSTSSYRLQSSPVSLGVLRNMIHNGRFPSYAPFPPKAPPPPPGGIAPRG